MRWEKIIHLLRKYGDINRSHLVEEDPSITRYRKKHGGKGRPKFVEGWVEFVNKEDAKTAVSLLNGNIVGGKKSGYFHDCIWNMKYLKGFKWPQLMEMLAYEKRIRSEKLRAEFSASKKEDERYLENVQKSVVKEKIQKKKMEKAKKLEAKKKDTESS